MVSYRLILSDKTVVSKVAACQEENIPLDFNFLFSTGDPSNILPDLGRQHLPLVVTNGGDPDITFLFLHLVQSVIILHSLKKIAGQLLGTDIFHRTPYMLTMQQGSLLSWDMEDSCNHCSSGARYRDSLFPQECQRHGICKLTLVQT